MTFSLTEVEGQDLERISQPFRRREALTAREEVLCPRGGLQSTPKPDVPDSSWHASRALATLTGQAEMDEENKK